MYIYLIAEAVVGLLAGILIAACTKKATDVYYTKLDKAGRITNILLIHAILRKFDSSILIPNSTTPLIYPYFFVNLETQGVSGVLMWIVILLAAFVAVGYLFFGLDRL